MKPARLVEFQNNFYCYLERVQATTDLISAELDVQDAYGLRSLTRRGVTAHAKVMHVNSDVIKAVHRWEKKLNSRSGFPRLDMVDTYDTLVSLVPLILIYSRSLCLGFLPVRNQGYDKRRRRGDMESHPPES
jgi:hypothetical protein